MGAEIEEIAGDRFAATNWMERNRDIFNALQVEKLVTTVTIGLIMLVAALNILTSLVMIVMEKNRDIAVLMSMGARQTTKSARSSCTKGLAIGTVGTVIGLVAGQILCRVSDAYRLIPLDAEIYGLSYVPFAANPLDAVLIGIAAIALELCHNALPRRSRRPRRPGRGLALRVNRPAEWPPDVAHALLRAVSALVPTCPIFLSPPRIGLARPPNLTHPRLTRYDAWSRAGRPQRGITTMAKELRIGMIGYGFMGRAHSNAYKRLNDFLRRRTPPRAQGRLCPQTRSSFKAFADRWGYERTESDWRKVVEADDVDLIDIGVPNNLHRDIAVAAAKAGKMICCEKPLAMNVAEAEEMTRAVEDAGVPNMVWYNYRRVPAIALAKQIVDEGRIGRPFHYRATYLQDWTINEKVPQGGAALWRLDINAAGSGVTGDLLAHSIDSAMWLNGPITRVVARTENFRERARARRDRQGRARRHRRRVHVPRRVRQRIDGNF